MNNRVKMLLISFSCLLVGSVIYSFSRPNVYISKFVLQMLNIKENYNFFPLVISFYVPDFLWSSALCSGLFVIYPLKSNKGWIWGAVTFLYGVVWEILQLFSIVSGTADVIDVLLYLAAAFAVVMINFNLEKRKNR